MIMVLINIYLIGTAMYICLCNGITDSQIRQCAREGAGSLPLLQAELGVAAGCGRCAEYALAILAEETDRPPTHSRRPAGVVSCVAEGT